MLIDNEGGRFSEAERESGNLSAAFFDVEIHDTKSGQTFSIVVPAMDSRSAVQIALDAPHPWADSSPADGLAITVFRREA